MAAPNSLGIPCNRFRRLCSQAMPHEALAWETGQGHRYLPRSFSVAQLATQSPAGPTCLSHWLRVNLAKCCGCVTLQSLCAVWLFLCLGSSTSRLLVQKAADCFPNAFVFTSLQIRSFVWPSIFKFNFAISFTGSCTSDVHLVCFSWMRTSPRLNAHMRYQQTGPPV